MAWIESHQKLATDPEMFRVAAELQFSTAECVGRLHLFWWWCVDHAETGDLRAYTSGVLAAAAGLEPMRGDAFLSAMIGNGNGFIERLPYLRLRNWWKFHGYRLTRKYNRSPAKWQAIETAYSSAGQQHDSSTTAVERQGGQQQDTTNKQTNKPKPTSAPNGGAEVVEEWNSLPETFARVRNLSDGRKKTLAARLKDDWWNGHWKAALGLIPDSSFLSGKNEKGWIADFDFFIRPDTVAKIVEGKYAARASTNGTSERKIRTSEEHYRE